MRFNPYAELRPGQIQDFRRNPFFYQWLAGKHLDPGQNMYGVDPRGRIVPMPHSPFGQLLGHNPIVPKAGWYTTPQRQYTLPPGQRRPMQYGPPTPPNYVPPIPYRMPWPRLPTRRG